MEACKWYASTALLCLFLYVIYLLLVSSSQVIINYMKSNNVIAISWFLLSLLISVFNDTIVKTLVVKISAESIAFWRTMLSAVILMPIVCKLGIQSIYTKKINVHVARGFILAIAISLWNYGIGLVPIATVTLMSFTIPIFTLVMASIFLHEKITYSILLATCVGLTGSIISLLTVDTSFPMASFIFIVASILFATLDIVNKKLLNDGESMLPMLFYSNLFSALFASFVPGSISEYYSAMPIYYVQLICLGVGANLVLYCIIKAFSYANASFLAPVRYMELVVSATTGYVIFNEVVSVNLIVGGVLILISLTIVNHMQRKIHVE